MHLTWPPQPLGLIAAAMAATAIVTPHDQQYFRTTTLFQLDVKKGLGQKC